MEKSKVDIFLISNSAKFDAAQLGTIRERLEKMTDDQFIAVHGLNYWDPTIILVIAILLGWERFFLNDIGLGVLKLVTFYGLGIWWLIDLFTAQDRARKYNTKRFMEAAALIG